MSNYTRNYHIKLNDGSETRRFRLLQTREGLAWRVGEQSHTPKIQENAAELTSEALPPEMRLTFAMDDWEWGPGLVTFTGENSKAAKARYYTGKSIDTTQPNRVRHGPQEELVGSLDGAPLDILFFSGDVWVLTADSIYSWDGTTLTQEDNSGAGTYSRFVVFDSKLYIARSGAQYYTFTSGGVLDTSPTPSGNAALFAAQGNRLWRKSSTNRISYITPSSTSWQEDIEIGSGEAINSLFVVSGLLFVGTTVSLYIVDSDFVPHEINQALRQQLHANNFRYVAEAGGEAWLATNSDTVRVQAAGFEEFDIFADGPETGTNRKPVNVDRGTLITHMRGMQVAFDAVYARGESPDLIWKAVDKGGAETAWTPLRDDISDLRNIILVARLTSESDNWLYYIILDGGTYKVHRFPVRDWPSGDANYADTWELITPYYDATLPTWQKVWWRLKVIVEMVGAGEAATLEVFAQKDDDASWTSIATIASDGENTLSLPNTFAGRRIRLKFEGTSGNSNADGIDLKAFALEGVLKPEKLPTYDFTAIAESKADADFLKGLRTKTVAITLTDRFDSTASIFVLPGTPVEQELIDEALREPVRTYRVIAQETPPTS